MLVTTRFGDTPQAHLVRFPGGARRQLTFFPERVVNPSFPPAGGDFFVFSQDTGGGEFFQNYRFDLATGRVTLLTDGKSRNVGAVWSRAGDRIAYISTRRNGKDTDLYAENPADPKSDRRVAELSGGGWQPLDWSPDGRRILVREGISVNESYLWLDRRRDGGEDAAHAARRRRRPSPTATREFLPDGRSILATTDEGSEFQRLVRIDLASGRREPLTSEIPWDVDGLRPVTRDGRRLAFVTNEDGASVLRVRDLATGKETIVPGSPRHRRERSPGTQTDGTSAFSFADARSPSDVYSYDADSGKVERWTEERDRGLESRTRSRPAEIVRWKSFDGRTISGLLYAPPKSFRASGRSSSASTAGPEGQSRPGFLGRNNYFVNELGVAILYPNVRGSTGFGKTFSRLDNGTLREDTRQGHRRRARLDRDPAGSRRHARHDHGRQLRRLHDARLRRRLQRPDPLRARRRRDLELRELPREHERLPAGPAARRVRRRARSEDARVLRADLAALERVADPQASLRRGGRERPACAPISESDQIVKTVRGNGTPVWYLVGRNEGHGFGGRRTRTSSSMRRSCSCRSTC